MEITLSLPIRDWYTNTTHNDLSYWGLDYPPLTAYQSYFHGLFLRLFHPDSVSLFASRGHESYLGSVFLDSPMIAMVVCCLLLKEILVLFDGLVMREICFRGLTSDP